MAPNSEQRNSGSQPDPQPHQGSAAAHPQADTYNFADLVRGSGVLNVQRPSTDSPAPSQADLRNMRRDMGVADGTGPGYNFADLVRSTLPSAQPDGSERAESRTSGTGPGYNFADFVRANLPRLQSDPSSGAASRPESGPAAAKRYGADNQPKRARRS